MSSDCDRQTCSQHELIPLRERSRWSQALSSLTHAYGHTWSAVAAFRSSSGDPTYLYVHRDRDGDVDVACPVALRGETGELDAYTPYGFNGFTATGPQPDFRHHWGEFARSRKWVASYALQHPSLSVDLGFPAHEVRRAGDTYVLEVDRPLSAVLEGMSKGRRAELRRWERQPARLTSDREWILAFFTAEAERFLRAREATGAYHLRTATWAGLLDDPNVIGVAVHESGRLVAASLFGISQTSADFLFAMSVPGAESYSAPLIWEQVKTLHERTITSVNLGGGIRPDDGVAEFKRRFGATPVAMTRLCSVHRHDTYQSLCAKAGLPGATAQGFFPPYRRRQ